MRARTPLRPAPKRSGARRPAALPHRHGPRLSDLVLAFLGLTQLGALGLLAGTALLGRALAP